MRRKLVKQGGTTYTISLPKEWIEKSNLGEGDEIDLEEDQTKIIISSLENKDKYVTKKYDLKNVSELIIPEFLVSLYKSGFNDLELSGLNKTKIDKIKEVITTSLVGFEILGSDKDRLHIVDLGKADEESIAKAEQQIFWRLLNMIDRILDEKSTEEEIKKLDSEINRLSFFIQRNVAKRFLLNSPSFFVYEKAYALELLGDFLRSFKIYSSKSSNKKEFLNIVSQILDKIRYQKITIQDISDIKKKIIELRIILKKSNKNDSNLSQILIIKTLKQLFDVTLTQRNLNEKFISS